ncbi:hypothetical protein A2U01_0081944, partial [Trifolium medium]|nr:hypothetical protein [Trifolium medium]
MNNNISSQVNQGLRRVSFRVAEDDLIKLTGAFVGTVAKPGMSYNIQEEFHMQ